MAAGALAMSSVSVVVAGVVLLEMILVIVIIVSWAVIGYIEMADAWT